MNRNRNISELREQLAILSQSNRILGSITRFLPGAYHVVRLKDHARLCRLWHVYLSQNLSSTEIFAQSAGLFENSALQDAITGWQDANLNGREFRSIVCDGSAIDRLLELTVRHATEAELPEALLELARVYDQHVEDEIPRVSVRWTIGLFVTMTAVSGLIIIGLFAPLIDVINAMMES